MMQPRLSICIPTFNRKKELGEAILSIVNQVDNADASSIEICISDNASTDGTEDLISEIQKTSLVKIVYSRSERNAGPDVNYLRAVEIASGDYCWFMGSDDAAVPGSVAIFLREIEQGHDIYLCNRVECDINMHPLKNRNWLDRHVPRRTYDFGDLTQFEQYTLEARSVGAFFSYLSSIVFKRKKWSAIKIDSDFIGSAYSHVYMLMSFIKTGCILKYIPDHLVLSRGDNDSFLKPGSDGFVKRIMIDINGYSLIAEKLFKDSKVHHTGVLRILHAERPALHTIKGLRLHTNSEEWGDVAWNLRKAGYSRLLLVLIGASKPLMLLFNRYRSRA